MSATSSHHHRQRTPRQDLMSGRWHASQTRYHTLAVDLSARNDADRPLPKQLARSRQLNFRPPSTHQALRSSRQTARTCERCKGNERTSLLGRRCGHPCSPASICNQEFSVDGWSVRATGEAALRGRDHSWGPTRGWGMGCQLCLTALDLKHSGKKHWAVFFLSSRGISVR